MTVFARVINLHSPDDDPPRQHQNVVPGLDGVVYLIEFDFKVDIVNAVRRLSGCGEHRGRHHFAVAGEGRHLYTSIHGLDCLESAAMLPKDFEIIGGKYVHPSMEI